MKLKTILSNALVGFMGLGMVILAGVSHSNAASGYPINHPRHVDWSFAGPFGHWDVGQLQRGFKVYKENCSACHSLDLVAFRNLEALGYNEDQIKAIASDYTVVDGPNADGEMYERPGVAADRFPPLYPNKEAAAASHNGAVPPDFSLLAKARAPERGFPNFVFDIFTQYAENGPDYIYSLLTGYTDAPEGVEVSEGTHYNPYFIAGSTLAMANPLSDDIVEYDDGTPGTVDQYAQDVAAFMMWAAEPTLVERKSLGFKVMIFLLLFASLLYLTKKKVWAGLYNEGDAGSDSAAPKMAAAGLMAAPVAAAATQSAAKPRARAKTNASAKVSKPAAAKVPAKKAVAAAKSKGPVRLSKPTGKADDLKMIAGVGPKLEKTLNGLGFWHFAQIAKWTKSDVAIVDDELSFKGRIERDDWIKQAKALAKGGRDEYVRVFGKEPR
jgi:ubiquinol-cytochrome c reductase cytochrome c1 subunit